MLISVLVTPVAFLTPSFQIQYPLVTGPVGVPEKLTSTPAVLAMAPAWRNWAWRRSPASVTSRFASQPRITGTLTAINNPMIARTIKISTRLKPLNLRSARCCML